MELTQKELSELAGYTYRRLLDINKALPEDAKLFVRSAGGKYDLGLFVRRWSDYNVARAKQDGGGDFNSVKAAHEAVKMQKSELELRKMRGELIEAEAVRRLWAHVATELTQKLLAVPPSVAPSLVMMDDIATIVGMVDAAIRSALTQVAETPIPEDDSGFAETDDQGEEE